MPPDPPSLVCLHKLDIHVTPPLIKILATGLLLNPLASLEWRECSEMPLVGMSDAQAVLLGEQVYMGGGDIRLGSSATLLIYDFTDDSWDLFNTPTRTMHSQLKTHNWCWWEVGILLH